MYMFDGYTWDEIDEIYINSIYSIDFKEFLQALHQSLNLIENYFNSKDALDYNTSSNEISLLLKRIKG